MPAPEDDDRELGFRPGMDTHWKILETGAESGGEFLKASNWIGHEMGGPPLHVHPHADDVFELLEGELEVYVDGEWSTIRAGETAVAPAGQPHTFRNSSGKPVRIINIHRPSQRFEEFFRAMHSLIEQGKIKALPPREPRSAIYAAMLFAAYPEEIRVVRPPNAVFSALARVGKLLRFKLHA
jgi:mannose-6-phosphate isomerase-like protein (cupin superfamily)